MMPPPAIAAAAGGTATPAAVAAGECVTAAAALLLLPTAVPAGDVPCGPAVVAAETEVVAVPASSPFVLRLTVMATPTAGQRSQVDKGREHRRGSVRDGQTERGDCDLYVREKTKEKR